MASPGARSKDQSSYLREILVHRPIEELGAEALPKRVDTLIAGSTIHATRRMSSGSEEESLVGAVVPPDRGKILTGS